jgi:hypothetical protein
MWLVRVSRLALIFRVPLNETQAQSRFATQTRNIPELGISTDIPLTEYRLDVVSTRDTSTPDRDARQTEGDDHGRA